MAKRKTVEAQHVAFLKTYFSKKLVEGTLGSLLADKEQLESAALELRNYLEQGDPEALNNWVDGYLSPQGRKTLWTAHRNIGYRKKSNRSAHELRKSVVDQLMEWAEPEGIDNVNDAVLALLEAQEQ